MSLTSVHSSSGTLSDLIPWIYLSLPLYNCKGFDLVILEWSSGFPYFLQFKSKFGNKQFMIWATVNSESCICWLYRASPSSAAMNIINLILVLTIWWCPCVESSLVLLEEGVCYDQCIFLAKLFSLCPALFCTPRPNLPVTPGISWFPTFEFLFPVMKRHLFWISVLEGLVGLHRTIQLQLLQHYWLGHRLGLLWYWMVCLGNEQRSFCHFWDCIQVPHLGLFCLLWGLLHFF